MKNEKGSTIVTALVITMILMILLGTCFAIASSYHNRSIANHQERQAYLTARSIVETISKEIKAGPNEDGFNAFIPKTVSQSIEFPNIQLTGDTCEERKATITLEKEDIIVIVATATNYGRTQEIQLTMQKDALTKQWKELQYSNKGETVYETE